MDILRRRYGWRWRGWLLAALLTGVGFAAYQNVPTAVTVEDREYAERILAAAGYIGARREFGDLEDFEGQVRAIAAVQHAVLLAAPTDKGVALDRTREPKDVFELRQGLCFDRSRAMEKLLSYLGLDVRHVAVYATADRSVLAALVTPENPSHAVTEVRTEKGWMLIDSNKRWMGITRDRRPVSTAELRDLLSPTDGWAAESRAALNPIFVEDYVFIYGLYSRHGRFYPPFAPFPDVNYRQLLDNL
jgi:hypothetical protein